MKPVVLALNAQFGVGAGGNISDWEMLRLSGALQWHGESDPTAVETCSRAGA